MAIKVHNKKLRALREKNGFSRAKVSEALKWNSDRLVNIEDGDTGQTDLTVSYIETLCNYYRVPQTRYINYDFRETKVIVIGCGKGGTTKTTSTGEITYQLNKKYKMLAIDGDPQGNLTKMLGINEITEKNLLSLITVPENDVNDMEVDDYVRQTRLKNTDIITFYPAMYGADRTLNTRIMPLIVFKKIKDYFVEQGKYDYILIDTSPQISTYTMGLYIMSDKFYMPVDMAAFTIDALPTFIEVLKDVKTFKTTLWPDKDFTIDGIIKTKVDMRTLVSKEVSYFLENNLPYPILSTDVPKYAAIEQAQINSQFIEEYDNTSKGAVKIIKAYEKISKEVIK